MRADPVARATLREPPRICRNNLAGLEQEILELARREAVKQESVTRHGTKYVLDGYLQGTRGDQRKVRTIWILEAGTPGPRLVTAYPV